MVWCWDEYELCENANLGLEGGWVFELTCKGFRVDLAPTMKGGKQLARDHAVRAEVKPRELVEQEQES